MKKRILSLLLVLLIMISMLSAIATPVSAATITQYSKSEIESKFTSLKSSYPDGKYWANANGTTTVGSYTTSKVGTISCGSYYCTSSCGSFSGAYQCAGYAKLLSYKLFGRGCGSLQTTYYTITGGSNVNLDKVVPGDIIRTWWSTSYDHSIVVTKVTSTTIYFTDCNRTKPCQIDWDGSITKTSLMSKIKTKLLDNSGGYNYGYVMHYKGNNYSSTPELTIKYNVNGGIIANSAVASYTYKVTESAGLNMRSGAGTSYSQITALPVNTTFTVSVGNTKSANGYTWGKTTYGGKTGWVVISDYVSKVSNNRNTKYYISDSLIYVSSSSKVHTQKLKYKVTHSDGLYNASTFGISKNGYTFKGWSTSASGGAIIDQNTPVSAEDVYPNIKSGDKTITVYAIWEANDYTIYYDGNGASGEMSSTPVSAGGKFTLSKCQFVKPGYKFVGWHAKRSDGKWYVQSYGWNTEADIASNGYTKKVYPSEKEFTLDNSWVNGLGSTGSYTFYAVWEETGVESIEIEQMPIKQVYQVGESFDSSGLKLKVNYKDGTKAYVTDGFEIRYDFTNPGFNNVIVTYDNFEISEAFLVYQELNVSVSEASGYQKEIVQLPLEYYTDSENVLITDFEFELIYDRTKLEYSSHYYDEECANAQFEITEKETGLLVKCSMLDALKTNALIFKPEFEILGLASDNAEENVYTVSISNLKLSDASGQVYNCLCHTGNVSNKGLISIDFDVQPSKDTFDTIFAECYQNVMIPSAKPATEGLVFKGWSSDEDNDTVEYNPGDMIETVRHSVILTAVWEETNSDITWTYNASSGALTISGSGPMPDYTQKTVPWANLQSQIYSINIEEGITSIGDWAFSYCYYARMINLPETLEEVGNYAFYNCISLEEVLLPESVESIGNNVFTYCKALQGVSIPKNITTISKYNFYDCNSLSNVYYAGTQTQWASINKTAYNDDLINSNVIVNTTAGTTWDFDKATGTLTISGYGRTKNYTSKTSPWYVHSNDIKKIVVEEGVTGLGNYAFGYCYYVTEITLPDSLMHIGSNVFYKCQSLESIDIPSGVRRIFGAAFYGCTKLDNITIPQGVDTIYAHTFMGCSSLTDVSYAGTKVQWEKINVLANNEALTNCDINYLVKSIEWDFDETTGTLTISGGAAMDDYELNKAPMAPWAEVKSQVTNIVIEDGIPNIGKNAFYGCANLKTVVIPDSVTSIGYGAFMGTGLRKINIPKNVTYIGSSAFNGCALLTQVNIPAGVKNIYSYTFYNCKRLASVSFEGNKEDINIIATGNEYFIDLI